MKLTPSQIRFEAALKNGAASGVSPAQAARLAYNTAQHNKRERAYQSFLPDTGNIVSIDDFLSNTEKREKSHAMGCAVADRLESLGLPGYSRSVSQVWLFAPHSGQYHITPNFARNNFNPVTAQEKRNTTLRELEYRVEQDPKKFRMGVISGGPHGEGRCTIDKFIDQLEWQMRKIREWNKSAAADFFEVYIEFRACELGSIFRKEGHKTRDDKGRFVRQYMRDENGQRIRNVDAQGNQTLHPHTHFIYRMNRFLEKREWNQFITAMQRHFNQKMPDHGAIADAREACKYVMKSDEVLHLRDADFVALYHALKKRKLVQPMGALQQQIRRHRKDGVKIRRVRVGVEGEGTRLKPVPNWNRSLDFEKSEIKPFTQPANETTLCARMVPMARFTPLEEPIFVFRGRVDLEAAYKTKAVQFAIARTKAAYEAAEQTFEALHGVKPVDWAIADAPLLAASRKVSAHTSPVTGEPNGKVQSGSKPGGSPSFGAAPTGAEKQSMSSKKSEFRATGARKSPVAEANRGSPSFGNPINA